MSPVPIKNVVKVLVKGSVYGLPMLFMYRAWALRRPIFSHCRKSLRWLLRSREYTNFTYNLVPLNREQLVQFVADLVSVSPAQVEAVFVELESDEAMASHVAGAASHPPFSNFMDKDFRPARRLAWYALVRLLKPRVVVETGIDKGMGACIICSALMRNSEEGFAGRYLGTDINPAAGFLLSGDYKKFGEILYGDSLESLRGMTKGVDIFINDSDHSSEYEAKEYAAVERILSEDALLLGDNAHSTNELLYFARRTGRFFRFFQERPLDHWIPGAGVGVAFKKVRPFQGSGQ